MLFRLDELQKGKEEVRNVSLERHSFEGPVGKVELENLSGELRFRSDPMGYVVKYNVRGEATMACVRCGEQIKQTVEQADWISLRVQQPEEHHVLLDDAAMNVRFITDMNFDMTRFLCEVIELELPTYPRHGEDNPSCVAPDLGEAEPPEESSPFGVLSKYLK